ncbi:MAG: nucleotidyltransferase domain-containing protein [Longimicrobiales bacterium]
MSPTDLAILHEFAARVRQLEPRAQLLAFGSRARGDAHPDSDLDVCVIVPRRTTELRRAVQNAAWETGFEHARVIATVLLEQDDFEAGPMSASTLVANIRAEGVAA